eukprot:m.75178 g.75178  ORF g.75178 m.75178 type:complete len:2506 (-) comp13123_c5_seq3:28-7545(-)
MFWLLTLAFLAREAASIAVEDCQRITPRGYNEYYLSNDLRFRYGANTSYVAIAGLAGGGSISFVSCQNTNRYLTISAAGTASFAVLNTTSASFAQQSSFNLVADAWYAGYFALQSFTDPTMYIVARNYQLQAARTDNSASFKESASFQFDAPSSEALTDGCMGFESVRFPAYAWSQQGSLGLFATDTFRLVPSNTSLGFVNILSCERNNSYLSAFTNGTVTLGPVANLSSRNTLFSVSLTRFNTPGFATFRVAVSGTLYLTTRVNGSAVLLSTGYSGTNPSSNFITSASFLPVHQADVTDNTTTPIEPEPALPAALARWVFLSSNGSTIPDVIGNQSATATRLATVIPACVFGACLRFNNSVFTVARPQALQGNFTFSFWALPSSQLLLFTSSGQPSTFVASASFPYVASQQSFATVPTRVCYLSVAVGLNGVALLAQNRSAVIPILMFSRPTPALTWNQYIVSVSNNVASLYIDGVLSAIGIAPNACTLTWNTTRFGTGQTATGMTGNFSGQLDDMALYNTSFSADDAQTAYTIDVDNARQCFTLAPADYPTYRVDVQRGGTVFVAPTTTDTFRLVTGLTGDPDSVSFRSCNDATRYLTVSTNFNAAGFAVVNLQTYNGTASQAQLATFIRQRDLFVNGSSSYESYRYPQFFLRNRGATNNFRVAVEQVTEDSSIGTQQSASFTRIFVSGTLFANTPCNGVTTYESDIGTWHFDEGYGTAVNDVSYLRNAGTLLYGARWTVGKIGLGLGFAPNNTNPRLCPQISFNRPSVLAMSNFSVSLWAMANLTHQIDTQSTSGTLGVSGQRYVMFPTQTTDQLGDDSIAALGISIGSNGVTVYGHAAFYMPALLVWQGDMTKWTFVTITCRNSTVSLYINGVFVKTGLFPTGKTLVLSLYTVGSGWYGAFSGKLDELRLFDYSLSAADIRAAYNTDQAASQSLCAVGAGSTAQLSCPSGQTIFAIESAAFATRTSTCSSFTANAACGQPASLTAVQNACVARGQCSVNLATSTFGDPCPAVNKSLIVNYVCSTPPSTTSSRVCSSVTGTNASISNFVCASGVITQFQFASFGRPNGTCGNFQASACDANVATYLSTACIGRTRCSVVNSELPRSSCATNTRLITQFICRNVSLPLDNCAQAPNNTNIALACPASSVISSISFASFGTPSGTCGSWRSSATCHAASTQSTLTTLCVGKQTCSVLASPRTFQLSSTGCAASPWLKVQYSCSPVLTSASVCKPVSGCGPGTFEQLPPSPYSDRVCATCAAGTYKTSNVTDVDCIPATPCSSGFYQTAAATPTSNTQCLPLTQCAPRQYAWILPTATSNRVCNNCTQCPNGTTTACTSTSDAVCATCNRVCNPLFQYEAVPCSRTGDRVCRNCSTCNATQYTAASCGVHTDTVCLPITSCTATQYLTANATATSNVVCANITVCDPASQYEATAPTATSNRVCYNFSVCSANEVVTSPPTATSDRECEPCPAGTAFNSSTMSCETCPSGQYVGAGSVSCLGTLCAPGTTDLDDSAASECVPCPLGTTQPLAGQSGPCMDIATCVAGTYQLTAGTPVQQTVCSSCPDGTFSSTAGATTCTPFASCPPGTMQALGGAPTPTSNRVCVNCSKGTFSSSADSACTTVKDCLPGFGVSVDPTPTSDRMCSECEMGVTFSTTTNTACAPITPCTASQFISAPATLTADQNCSLITSCNSTSFQLAGPTLSTDRVCRQCSPCPASRFVQSACSATADTQCQGCGSCTAGVSYETQACTASTNRQCTGCDTCGTNQFQVSPCNVLANIVCQNLTVCSDLQFEVTAPTAVSNRVCHNLTLCSSSEYESVAPTATSDRSCASLNPCKVYEIVSRPPSATSDWVCASCDPGQSAFQGACVTCGPGTSVPDQASLSCDAYNCQPGSYSLAPTDQCTACNSSSYQPSAGASACIAASDCDAGFELSVALSPVADRQCTPCKSGFYKSLPGVVAFCVQADPCSAGYFQVTAPTATSNRVCNMCATGTFKSAPGNAPCQPISSCQPGQSIVAVATITSDTQCAQCVAGSFDASGNGTAPVCQSCPSGSYVAAGTTGPCAQCRPGTADLDSSPATPCESCPDGSFQAQAGRTACQLAGPCSNGTGMSIAPTATSDRVCSACAAGSYYSAAVSAQLCASACAGESIEFSAPTLTSDRVCSFPVVAVLPIDFGLLGNSSSPAAAGLRTNFSRAIVNGGVPSASILAIKFAPGSTVATVDISNAANAQLLTQLIANGTLDLSFQGQTVKAAPSAAPSSTSRDSKSSSPIAFILIAIAAIALIALVVALVVRRRNRKALYRVGQPQLEQDSRNLSFTNPIYNEEENSEPPYMDMAGLGAAGVSPSYGDHAVYAVPQKRKSSGATNPLYDMAATGDQYAERDASEYMEASGLASGPAPRWTDADLDAGYMAVQGQPGQQRAEVVYDHADDRDGYMDVKGTAEPAAAVAAEDEGDGYMDVKGIAPPTAADEGDGPLFRAETHEEDPEDVGYVEFSGKEHDEPPSMA